MRPLMKAADDDESIEMMKAARSSVTEAYIGNQSISILLASSKVLPDLKGTRVKSRGLACDDRPTVGSRGLPFNIIIDISFSHRGPCCFLHHQRLSSVVAFKSLYEQSIFSRSLRIYYRYYRQIFFRTVASSILLQQSPAHQTLHQA